MRKKELFKLAEIRVSNVDKKIYPDKELVKLCNYMDVYNNDYINSNLSYSIGSADANELLRFGLKKNDVIITKDSETPDDIAISSIVTEDIVNLVCGYHLAIIRPNSDELDGMFLMFKLKDNEIVRYFSNAAKGSTRFGLSIGDIENVIVKYPSLPEQYRIAHILSTCDAVIEKTQTAVAKYKAIKQGMLHDLFTRGIDIRTGKLRPRCQDAPELYKESKLGWIPKEWDCEGLSSVVEIISGGTPSTQVKEYWNGEIPWLSVDDFNTGNRYASNAAKKITDEGFKNSATNMLLPGMLIISARGTVGVISQMKIPMAFNQSCYGLNSTNKYLSNDFLYYFLTYFIRFIGFNSYGSVFDVITRNSFDEVFIPINKKSDEQRLIVERLTAIDNKLQTEQTYLQKMQQLKKGLMEDLLSGRKKVSEPLINQIN
ncbi:MAG TPA: restriction endonuclease subunit S [Bacteroidales bacterium]|nr:restriction endonuclease subunit S [Bacteroidales bacterium]